MKFPNSKDVKEKLDQQIEEHSNTDEKESNDEGAPEEEKPSQLEDIVAENPQSHN